MNTERKIFGHPIRRDTTLEMYSDKMTLEEFCAEIKDSIDGYQANMEMLEGRIGTREMHIEQWVEEFLAWMDVEEESRE